jgi:hypothetical protein
VYTKGRSSKSFEFHTQSGTIRDPHPTFNILVVTTRERDDDNRIQVTRPLFAALSGIEGTCHFNVEVVRQGTWAFFKKHIEGKKRGWSHVVHVDVPVRGR